MPRPRSLSAVAILCLSIAVSAQPSIRPIVPPAIQVHVRDERFQPVTAVRGLPLGVREELQRMFGSTAMAIADPGERFQVTDVITEPSLPIRRMSVAGCSQDHCLVYYERGGIAHTWHAVLFHWTPDGTRVEAGGTAPAGIRSLDDLRNAVLSGVLKG
ncbi:MAG: hypothetical protein IT178_07235, partial [Acidobacteria bacterium]|nr:hypothetical protein [Acidobacteriota bacterium]